MHFSSWKTTFLDLSLSFKTSPLPVSERTLLRRRNLLTRALLPFSNLQKSSSQGISTSSFTPLESIFATVPASSLPRQGSFTSKYFPFTPISLRTPFRSGGELPLQVSTTVPTPLAFLRWERRSSSG